MKSEVRTSVFDGLLSGCHELTKPRWEKLPAKEGSIDPRQPDAVEDPHEPLFTLKDSNNTTMLHPNQSISRSVASLAIWKRTRPIKQCME